MDKVRVQQVIVCTKGRRGKGSSWSPVRVLTEIFNFNGTLIAESDPYSITPEDLLDFLRWHSPGISVAEHMEKIDKYFLQGGKDE